jgi:hypothetical protein
MKPGSTANIWSGLCFRKGGKIVKTESSGFVFLRLLGRILLADLILFIIIGAICWLGGWRTMKDYSAGLMYGGMGALLLGGLSALGGTGMARDPTYRYIQSVMSNSLSERTKRDWQENLESISFMVWMGIAGVIAIATGYLLTTLH